MIAQRRGLKMVYSLFIVKSLGRSESIMHWNSPNMNFVSMKHVLEIVLLNPHRRIHLVYALFRHWQLDTSIRTPVV